MEMSDSILITIKKMLGIDQAYTPFDMDIIVFINSTFLTLHQLGIGPAEGFSIRDYSAKWSDFLADDENLRAVQEYIYMKVRMVFDPPGNSFVMNAFEEQCREFEWRMNVHAESSQDFHFVEKENNPRI